MKQEIRLNEAVVFPAFHFVEIVCCKKLYKII